MPNQITVAIDDILRNCRTIAEEKKAGQATFRATSSDGRVSAAWTPGPSWSRWLLASLRSRRAVADAGNIWRTLEQPILNFRNIVINHIS
jgi:hypothetical protein